MRSSFSTCARFERMSGRSRTTPTSTSCCGPERAGRNRCSGRSARRCCGGCPCTVLPRSRWRMRLACRLNQLSAKFCCCRALQVAHRQPNHRDQVGRRPVARPCRTRRAPSSPPKSTRGKKRSLWTVTQARTSDCGSPNSQVRCRPYDQFQASRPRSPSSVFAGSFRADSVEVMIMDTNCVRVRDTPAPASQTAAALPSGSRR